MAPMKRSASTAAGGKKKKVAAGVEQQCKVVAEALADAEAFPKPVLQMLSASVKQCLGVPKEERHSFQEQVIDMVRNVLTSVQSGMEEQIQAAEQKVASADGEKSTRDAAAEAAAAVHAQKVEATAAAKAQVAATAEAQKAAKEAMVAAIKEQQAGDAELNAAAAKLEKLTSCKADCFEPLSVGSLEAAPANEAVSTVSQIGKEFKFDSSMLTSLPSAILKRPDQRGSFDVLVISQAAEELQKHVAGLEQVLAAGAPPKQQRADKVAQTSAASEAAVAAAQAAKDALKAAQGEEKEAEQAKKAAAKAVQSFMPEMKQVASGLDELKTELDAMKDGPVTAFLALLERTEIVPEAPAAEAA